MPENTYEFLIIGAGPTGLGAAIQLERHRGNWHLFDSLSYFGGLAASFTDDAGFTWDLGGHVQFSHYQEFDRWMDSALGPEGWYTHVRESWIRMEEKWIPYPLQYNLHRLPPQKRWACVKGLLECSQQDLSKVTIRNFDEWISATLGEPFNDLFMRPYCLKVWGYPISSLDHMWIDERVAVPRLHDVLRSICLNEDYKTWGPNRTFRYPRQGGMGSVWGNIGGKLPPERISLNRRVVEIDPQAHVLTTDDGVRYKYDYLISSMPLDHLVRSASGIVAPELGDTLVHNYTEVVGIGLEGQPPDWLRSMCWMYFPEDSSPYFRVTVFSNYSPNNVPHPGKQWSLLAEISGSSHREVKRDTLADDVVASLKRDGLIEDTTPIVSKVTRHVPYGYPVPFLGRDAVVNPILREFEKRKIYSRGRFGTWKYEVSNQDHSFMQGIEVVEHIMNGHEEQTLHYPSRINARQDNPFPYPEWRKGS